MTVNSTELPQTYRYKLAPQFFYICVIYLVVVAGRAIEDFGRRDEIHFVYHVLGHLVFHWRYLLIMTCGWLLAAWLSPVTLENGHFRAPNFFGFQSSLRYSEVKCISTKYFLGIEYYYFQTEKKSLFAPIVWRFLKNIDHCLNEIRKRSGCP